MKWVTWDHVHLDRVACPWLIRRFVDPEAEFLFMPWGSQEDLPRGAIPFAIPGVELGRHDEQGPTFSKIMGKYGLDDPALAMMAQIVSSGVHHATHKGKGDENDVPVLEGIGLDAISEGMMLSTESDSDNLDKSMAIYDALYAYCKARVLMSQDDSLAQRSMLQRIDLLKGPIRAALAGEGTLRGAIGSLSDARYAVLRHGSSERVSWTRLVS